VVVVTATQRSVSVAVVDVEVFTVWHPVSIRDAAISKEIVGVFMEKVA
jgi:hypothetical protein